MASRPLIRDAVEGDISQCADVVFASFSQLAERHRAFSFTAQSRENSLAIVAESVLDPQSIALVAVDAQSNEVIGLVACGADFGIHIVAVAVGRQSQGLGRTLVEAALARGGEGAARTAHLTVDSYNSTALALYLRCGFQVRGALEVMELPAGRTEPPDPELSRPDTELLVRGARPEDIAACTALARASGLEPADELSAHLSEARVVCRGEQLVGYCTRFSMDGHLLCAGVAEAQALLRAAAATAAAAAAGAKRPMLCVPMETQPELARWMVEHGWRCVKTLLAMANGAVAPPAPGVALFPRC